MFFTPGPVADYTGAKRSDTKAFGGYFRHMLEHGIYIAPSQFEAMFLSLAHTEEDICRTLDIMHRYFEKTKEKY